MVVIVTYLKINNIDILLTGMQIHVLNQNRQFILFWYRKATAVKLIVLIKLKQCHQKRNHTTTTHHTIFIQFRAMRHIYFANNTHTHIHRTQFSFNKFNQRIYDSVSAERSRSVGWLVKLKIDILKIRCARNTMMLYCTVRPNVYFVQKLYQI